MNEARMCKKSLHKHAVTQRQKQGNSPLTACTNAITHFGFIHKPFSGVTVRQDLSSVRYEDVRCQPWMQMGSRCQKHLPATAEAI